MVTFSLREAFFASQYTTSIKNIRSRIKLDDILSAIEKRGYEVSLLWQGKYAWDVIFEESDKIPGLNSFYTVEDAILIWNNGWCGTNYKNAERLLASIESELT